MDKPRCLLDAIRRLPNQSLWQHMDLDGDGNWIIDALLGGTLAVAHDGSFKEHVDMSVCSAGLVLFCTKTNRLATISCAEKTRPGTASNYRGEFLGGLLLALLIHCAGEMMETDNCPPVVVACDNMGVVNHSRNRYRPLKEKQRQASSNTVQVQC